MSRMVFSADDCCDVGEDTGAPVSPDYAPRGNVFSGRVKGVQIAIVDAAENLDHLVSPEHAVRIRHGAAVKEATRMGGPVTAGIGMYVGARNRNDTRMLNLVLLRFDFSIRRGMSRSPVLGIPDDGRVPVVGRRKCRASQS